jgi:hypothetical protein
MSTIPIAIGPGKTWTIKVGLNPAPEDVERFIKVIQIVLSADDQKHPSKKDEPKKGEAKSA